MFPDVVFEPKCGSAVCLGDGAGSPGVLVGSAEEAAGSHPDLFALQLRRAGLVMSSLIYLHSAALLCKTFGRISFFPSQADGHAVFAQGVLKEINKCVFRILAQQRVFLDSWVQNFHPSMTN